ncbi:MAG TPA: (Fe-S)-binding protein [Bryobacteraceae bacterium]|nr:(Fe-S)-binding protein [Bryobacteraceae bacterium]
MPDAAQANGLEAFPELQKELDRCMKCGFCMSVCPVYNAEKTEGGVARGKITIAEAVIAGDLALDDQEVIDMLFNCLVCKSCMQACPSGVQFDRIMLDLRAAIVKKNGLPWLKTAIFAGLKSPRFMDSAMKTGAFLQGLVFREDLRLRAISPRSPFAILGQNAGFDENRRLPSPTTKPLRDRVPEIIPAPDSRMRVAFFTGCSFHYFYPQTGLDLIDVLTENHIEVVVPKGQQCCGTPVLVHGDEDSARTLARRNIDAMDQSGAEYIVTGCGSCGAAWQHEFARVLGDDPMYGPKVAYWSARTFDISTFLTKVIEYRKPEGQVAAVVTYHDPCHLKKSMQVFREPRQILRDIPGVIFQEMAKPDACCGSGGSYGLTHSETSANIAQKKANDAAATGASTIATGCPACMMQLLDSTHRFGSKQRVRHYISLLADAYRAENEYPAEPHSPCRVQE